MNAIGIDIGGTKINIARITDTSISSSVLATPKNKKDFFREIKDVVSTLYVPGLKGIGIGFPGFVDDNGVVRSAPHLKFLLKENLFNFFKEFNLPFSIDNDVRCAARAELRFGAAKGLKNAVLIAIGTGIGGAIIIDGKIYRGNGAAGEIGHMLSDNNKFLEDLSGGATFKKFDSQEFILAGRRIGNSCASLANIFDPEALIFTGGLVENHWQQLMPKLKANMQKYLFNPDAKKIKILRGSLGEFAGAIGAATLV